MSRFFKCFLILVMILMVLGTFVIIMVNGRWGFMFASSAMVFSISRKMFSDKWAWTAFGIVLGSEILTLLFFKLVVYKEFNCNG